MSTETNTATTELANGAAPVEHGAAATETQQDPNAVAAPSETEGGATQNETPEHRKASYRFSEMSRQLREKDIQLARLAERAELLERFAQNAPPLPPPAPAPVEAKAPDWNDKARYPGGQFDPQYVEDKAAFIAEEKVRKAFEERERREAEAKTTAEREAIFNEGRAKFIDTMQAAEALEASNPQLAGVKDTLEFIARKEPFGTPGRLIDVITNTENPQWVAAALATKEGLLQQIGSLDPTARTLAIGRIDAQISANLRAQKAAPAPGQPAQNAPPSNTPSPAPALNGRNATPSFNPERASMAEYAAWRASQPH